MNCWHCGTELIWGGDHDMEDDYDYDMVTNHDHHPILILFHSANNS